MLGGRFIPNSILFIFSKAKYFDSAPGYHDPAGTKSLVRQIPLAVQQWLSWAPPHCRESRLRFRFAIPFRGLEIDVVGLPRLGRITHIDVGLFDAVDATALILFARQTK